MHVTTATRELEPGFHEGATRSNTFGDADVLTEVAVCDCGVLGRQSERERDVDCCPQVVHAIRVAEVDPRDPPHSQRTNDVFDPDVTSELDALVRPRDRLLGPTT